MSEEPVRLRPIEEADLDSLRRFDTDPSSRGSYLPAAFHRPQARRRRWDEDGWLGGDVSQLAVVLPDGTLVGIVSWRTTKTAGPEGGCLDIGALLFPEHRGKGLGATAQRLLAEDLFARTQVLVAELSADIPRERRLRRRGHRGAWIGSRPAAPHQSGWGGPWWATRVR